VEEEEEEADDDDTSTLVKGPPAKIPRLGRFPRRDAKTFVPGPLSTKGKKSGNHSSSGGKFTCPYCKQLFLSGGGYLYHESNRKCLDYEDNTIGTHGVGPWQCPSCQETFQHEKPYRYHIRTSVCVKSKEKGAVDEIIAKVSRRKKRKKVRGVEEEGRIQQ